MSADEIQTIIDLLRNSDRPKSHAKLMDDAATALADCKGSALLWQAFEEYVDQIDDDVIERTDQEIISATEGNANLDTCAVSGDWERIFECFLDVVKRQILKWPGYCAGAAS